MPEVDVKKIVQAARNSIPLKIKTYTLSHETELYLEEVLGIFLREMGQDSLKDPLAYCLRELAVNGKKANTKRVYFIDKGLSLSDDAQYQEGMKTFKQETMDNMPYYLDLLKKHGLYVRVIFRAKGNKLHLYIANNTKITKKEQLRIYDRIARSRAFETLEEALTTVLDDSEGAGLGIVILVLMLRKIGLTEEAFDIDVRGEETVAELTIPMSEVHLDNLKAISKELTASIESLPQFPANITELQRLIDDPESKISDIAHHVMQDAALTGDLLREVNSAAFMLSKRVESIVEAVKIMGMRGLRTLLFSYGTQKVLGKETPETKNLWRHSHRTAFYAYQLARSIRRQRDVLDDVYVGGILHDMGKIIFAGMHPELIDRIDSVCRSRGIPTQLFEDLTKGLNHAEIGAMIAEKWNFPERLVQTIRYHHTPEGAKPENRGVVDTVYLANSMANFREGLLGFDQIDPSILSGASITSEEQFATIEQRLSDAFEKQRDERT